VSALRGFLSSQWSLKSRLCRYLVLWQLCVGYYGQRLGKVVIGCLLGKNHPMVILFGRVADNSRFRSDGSSRRVARWYIFKPKILIWVNFEILEGLGMEKVGIHIACPFGIYYGRLIYFMGIW
jgi:hypothetical protein